MGKYLLRFMVLCAPLMLVSCGEGWVVQRIDNVVPYGSRTAGSGVAYVRAKMLPEKELKVEPITVTEPEPVIDVVPALDAEKIFNEAQTKGRAPVKKKTVSEKLSKMNVTKSDGDVLAEVEKIESGASGLSAEEYIKQEPKRMANLSDDVVKDALATETGQMEKSVDLANVMPAVNSEVEIESVIEVHENKVVKPAKEIISPKNDYFDFKSKGQYDLDDIYDDPFVDF
ncbi:MAG: hypothetical protein COB36_01845 [Alphaproteobacteria bacterium]|nr:MAG: hypothetical protein COB36_01845 [Alphaproteobacteria bacterium]